jgi:hypothetical protein
MGPAPADPSIVKTTLDIDDDLLRRAKQAALDRDTTLRAIVEEALERSLGPVVAPVPLRTVVWPPVDPAGVSTPVEHEHEWLARIKAVRYGYEPGGPASTGAAEPPARRGRPRTAKARKR